MGEKSKIIKFFEILEKIACFIIFALACLTVINAIARRAFNTPIYGVTEIVEYGTLAAICLAAGNATLNRVHPAVSLLTNKLKPRTALAVLLCTDFVSLAVLLYVGIGLVPNVAAAATGGRVTDSLGISYGIVYGLVVLCIFVVAAAYVLLMGRDATNLHKSGEAQAVAAARIGASMTPIAKDSGNTLGTPGQETLLTETTTGADDLAGGKED